MTKALSETGGRRGCQVWRKIGTAPPASVSGLHDLAPDQTSEVSKTSEV